MAISSCSVVSCNWFAIACLELDQWPDCPSINVVTLKAKGQTDRYQLDKNNKKSWSVLDKSNVIPESDPCYYALVSLEY